MNKKTARTLRKWRGDRTLQEAGAIFGVSAVQWFRYENQERDISPENVIKFEKETGISRHSLRPDVFGPAPKNRE